MRLSRIRIAGFKSFVDPTDLKLPSSLIGIVGPNGCGKSNIIDAVRWVMGESSAKQLRGESMDDVIFVGSRTRQPVGQASVELVFDNSEGRLGGEYAGFSEIAIRREVSRDGQSKFALNGVRCRRRDIRDIFLGTGLGPRSYAIIEQGMISRLIDAKPEDMRVFLEEAAGISKYKERRRETETRIRHTRENLDRLDDLREEVDKQLARLQRQARMAEKFQTLKQQERLRRGELLVLRRRAFEQARDSQVSSIRELETSLEAVVAEQRAAEKAIELARTQQAENTEQVNQAQSEYYRAGSEVARMEQTIAYKRESREQQNQELAEVNRLLDETRQHLEEDKARIAQIDEAMLTDQPAYDSLLDTQKLSAEHLTRAETELQQWQVSHENFTRRFSEVQQTTQVERSRIEQLERTVDAAAKRLQRLREEREALDPLNLTSAIEEQEREEQASAGQEQRLKESLAATGSKQQIQKDAQRQSRERLNSLRARQQSLLGRLASLEALQQAALAQDQASVNPWLQANNLDSAARLAQVIHVEPGWERAVEQVLGTNLEAVCVPVAGLLERCVNECPDERLTLMVSAHDENVPATQTLASKVSGEAPLAEFLESVLVADSAARALQMQTQLQAGQSVITPDGMWLGRSWLQVQRAESHDSVLLRENELTDIRLELDQLDQQIKQHESELADLERRQAELESIHQTQLHAFNDAVREHSGITAKLSTERQRLQQMQQRMSALQDEIIELDSSVLEEQQNLADARTRRAEAMSQLDSLESEKQLLDTERQTLRENLDLARQQHNADRDAGQELAIKVESMRSTRQATEQNLQRMQERLTQLSERQSSLDALLASEEDDTLESLQASLQQYVDARLISDKALRSAREQLEGIEQRLREHEQARQRHDSSAQSIRDQIQEEKLASQEAVVRLKTLDEQLAEQDYKVEDIVQVLPEDASAEVWAETLAAIEKQVERLGPINLAAIDELAEQQERKQYLDEQHADVTEALETLERAIAKIDKETRSRFKDTFDNVNTKVQEYFPRLFGGGQGSLELTGDDLLSTGVVINAQPPGKRVSNIQLLSGGEKALTAVALVFAFFELNPSPFCMLDEVDAPLDDANVGRYCQLVTEMSERVQFIFITHNKVTMEMSNQLMGVTMNEPGVSRLVAVDVKEAVELAGA